VRFEFVPNDGPKKDSRLTANRHPIHNGLRDYKDEMISAPMNFTRGSRAVLILVACLSTTATLASDSPLLKVPLNGEWVFSIHGRGRRPMVVPSTYLPVGGAILERTFQAPKPADGRRALLHFEGISTTAGIWLNDHRVGEFGPFTPFSLDVTDFLKAGINDLRVELSDLDGFDPWNRNWLPAFPRYGGIIRDVFLEWKPSTYIENARLDYKLTDGYTRSECQLHIWIRNTEARPAEVTISGTLRNKQHSYPFRLRAAAAPGTSMQMVGFSVPDVSLWSPDFPNLYDLSIELAEKKGTPDHFVASTGFREFLARGRDFFLNGKKFFIKGIFRHDMYGDQGHTITAAQMESDMEDIRSLGANFVRLGHYPHHPLVPELAARYGLMVSGEPPIFALNQKDHKVVAGAKFCLEGLIRRDWNNPAVVIWFLSNEVGTDLGYMKEMSAFVRSLDPSRLVGIVDNTKWTAENAPWSKFREAKIDFIAQNAYGSGVDGSYAKTAAFLPGDLPYMISEWGGTNDSYPDVLREGQYYLDHSNLKLQDGPRIAGISFWQYADVPSPRWSPEGLLHWSITDKYRHPYETYYALKSLYTGKALLPPRGLRLVAPVEEGLPRRIAPFENYGGYEPVDISHQVNSESVVQELKPASGLAYPEDLTMGYVAVAGLPFKLDHQVVMLSERQSHVRIPVGKSASEIEFLGQVCFNSLVQKKDPYPGLPYLAELGPGVDYPPPFKAYPLSGGFGDPVAEYVISYDDGTTETVPLMNGIHFADYRLFFSLSDIDSVATDTERAVTYKGDYGTKRYQLRLFSYRPRRPGEKISYIDFNLKNHDYVPMLAGVTLQEYEVPAH
jgi:beta-glucuronidase